MLLRASRASSELTKRAFLGRAAKAVVQKVKDPLGAIGGFASKHKKLTIGGVLGGATATAGAAEGYRRASKGVEAPYPQMSAPGPYNLGR